MYIYITSQLNQGYKVGIAEDIDQRQQQYTTLIPNLSFNVAVQTLNAEEIERSFKHRFQEYRILNYTSSKVMKSEIYAVKLKYLFMHLAHCMHRYCRAFIIEDNHLAFSKNSFLKNKVNVYLSNYYLLSGPHKFFSFSNINLHGLWSKIKIGEIIGESANFNKEGKLENHNIKLIYNKLNKQDFLNCSKLHLNNYGVSSQSSLNSEIENMNLKKGEETFEGFFLTKSTYVNPYKLAINWLSKIWFINLIKFGVLREYNYKKLEDEGTFRGTLKYLKLFNYPYPEKIKIKFPKREKIDNLL